MSRKKHIAVTGFEAFGRFKTNPASVVVQNLATIEFSTDIQVTTELCVVAYDAATTCSEQLCLKTCPDFIVHVGVAGPWPDTIHLEEESFSHGYCQRDVKGFVPFMNCSSTLTDQKTRCTLRTNLDCEAIAAALEPEYPELTITTSTDPGRFLCAYIYFNSLQQFNGRALFIHIPPFSEIATEEVLTHAVADIIKQIATRID